ncbi:hypothetical protein ACFFNY_02410 [Paenibacillus hodogayensis]|uniref:DNA mismatch repair protein n=1 Tax=Paenibacillus hodogayensis TaxID=279208 RepID=A0ABV5VQW7_9BACL
MSKLRFATKQKVIELGLAFLDGAGAGHVCKVCIASGGSCCQSCIFLKEGAGCQKRNTSCTAWLCGFLKYILYEAGMLHDWEAFWEQVPGQKFREDETPPFFPVDRWLDAPDVVFLSQAFVEDLNMLLPSRNMLWIHELKETLDRYVDKIMDSGDPETVRKVEKKIDYMMADFRHFRTALERLA